jgi:hypothetical protein
VDVDAGSTLTTAESQAQAEEFFRLVPSVATSFATALNQPLSSMPAEVKQKVQEQHTHSLPAVLAFGKALDGLDHHDTQAALEACKEVEKADPNFKLAKKKCAFVPLAWLSPEGVAAAMESTAFAMAGGATTPSYLVPGIIGALVVGGIAGGTYAAVHNGGGGGGGGGLNPPGNNAPQLNGVSDRTVGAGQTAAIDMTCNDPDGTVTTIANPNPPPGSSFTQTSGIPASGRYRQQTTANQVGQSFTARFTCDDSGNPPASTSKDATIRVVQQAQPTPTTALAPTPTPRVCQSLGTQCNPQIPTQCCSNNCDPELTTCCVATRGSCSNPEDCCTVPSGFQACQGGSCCLPDNFQCSGSGNQIVADPDCCGGTCYFGFCVTFGG